jgi:hypothetical protein
MGGQIGFICDPAVMMRPVRAETPYPEDMDGLRMDLGVIAVGHAIYVSASLGRPLRSGSVRFLTGAKTVSGMNRSSRIAAWTSRSRAGKFVTCQHAYMYLCKT